MDTLLGPEMKSTGEVMGIDSEFGPAYAKAQFGAGQNLPTSGTVFISVIDNDKKPSFPWHPSSGISVLRSWQPEEHPNF